MSTIRPVELDMIDQVFRGAERGYILDFSNRTFSEFFALELDVDIDAKIYQREGTSKGKRLRGFLSIVDDGTAAKLLRLLWEHREAITRSSESQASITIARRNVFGLIARLEGSQVTVPTGLVPAPKLAFQDFSNLLKKLMEVRNLRPQSRGYAFEGFLKELFDAFGLSAREPFKLNGEQIDGSFLLQGETYLLEAKWLNRKVGNAELHTFHGKVEQKASWSRGLFVSFGGFTPEGLIAFGRGKRVICMEGREIKEALEREIGINELVAQKVRRAAETGEVHTPIEALFPSSP